MEALFLTHEGYFGALGTFLKSAFGEDLDKVLSLDSQRRYRRLHGVAEEEARGDADDIGRDPLAQQQQTPRRPRSSTSIDPPAASLDSSRPLSRKFSENNIVLSASNTASLHSENASPTVPHRRRRRSISSYEPSAASYEPTPSHSGRHIFSRIADWRPLTFASFRELLLTRRQQALSLLMPSSPSSSSSSSSTSADVPSLEAIFNKVTLQSHHTSAESNRNSQT